MPAPRPASVATRVSLMQQSALFRIGLAFAALLALWVAIAWAIALP